MVDKSQYVATCGNSNAHIDWMSDIYDSRSEAQDEATRHDTKYHGGKPTAKVENV